ncbi:hypothetical protein [Pleomorphomonas sp. JP5]|uniref:hypothetical protein n=1 Tax=Pleomorphomonas sp. JP5 TaxID=2942998 RepID=UPI002043FA1A|nr:hypothetical protein [Pleomorphomonas sp. JP5]MCM5558486.1 hypothetical protein [Pleomorphomonas sp. JP5]
MNNNNQGQNGQTAPLGTPTEGQPDAAASADDQITADAEGNAGATDPVSELPTRPETIPAEFWDDENGLKADEFGKAFADLTATLTDLKAKAEERATDTPAEAGGYVVDVAALGLPDGVELDENDPALKAARELAFEKKFTKAEFQSLVGFEVQRQIAERTAYNNRLSEERAKLGDNAGKRIDAVTNSLVGRLGEKGRALLPLMATAAAVEAFETLLRQSGTSFNNSGRTETDPHEIEGYETMTFRQRMAAIESRKARS